jgi:hypothetical protein
MISIVGNCIHDTMNRRENFDNQSMSYSLAVSIAVLLYLILILLFGKFLWNQVLVKLVSGVNKVTSIWQILGLSLLIMLLFPK